MNNESTSPSQNTNPNPVTDDNTPVPEPAKSKPAPRKRLLKILGLSLLAIGCVILIIQVAYLILISMVTPKSDNPIVSFPTLQDSPDSSITYIPQGREQYRQIGGNLFYDKELLEQKSHGESKTLARLELISKTLAEDYPGVSILISNLNEGMPSWGVNDESTGEEHYYNGYQLVDDTIIEGSFFTVVMQDNEIEELGISESRLVNEDIIQDATFKNFDSSKDEVTKLIKENQKTIFSGSSIPQDATATITIHYDPYDEGLYYQVSIEASYIKIDIKTGEVIDTYFDSGVRF